MTDMMNFQSLPRDDRPAPAVQSTPTSASPLRPLPTRHEAIGSVFEVSGGRARIQISGPRLRELAADADPSVAMSGQVGSRSEEHTSELQSLMRTSYAVFCLNKKQKAQ